MELSLIEKNKQYYRKSLVVDNMVKGSGKISFFSRAAYLRVKRDHILYSQCKRVPIKVGKIWGYTCYVLNKENILYKVDMNWMQNRPFPVSFSDLEIIATKEDAILMYERISGEQATFCNANTGAHVYEFGSVHLSNYFLVSIDDLNIKLKEGLQDNFFTFRKSNHDEAVEFSEAGGLAIAINHDHVAPIIGKNVLVNKKDKVVDENKTCAWCLNIGAKKRDGYNSILFSFYVNSVDDLDYYIMLKKGIMP